MEFVPVINVIGLESAPLTTAVTLTKIVAFDAEGLIITLATPLATDAE